jgi:hypothetical protein
MSCDLLTIPEAAKRARVHPQTLRQLIRDGQGPAATHISAKTLIQERHLWAWIDACTVPVPERAVA